MDVCPVELALCHSVFGVDPVALPTSGEVDSTVWISHESGILWYIISSWVQVSNPLLSLFVHCIWFEKFIDISLSCKPMD
jgi:hypothetical protein